MLWACDANVGTISNVAAETSEIRVFAHRNPKTQLVRDNIDPTQRGWNSCESGRKCLFLVELLLKMHVGCEHKEHGRHENGRYIFVGGNNWQLLASVKLDAPLKSE